MGGTHLEGGLELECEPYRTDGVVGVRARRQAERERVALERLPNFEIGAQWSLIDEVEGRKALGYDTVNI